MKRTQGQQLLAKKLAEPGWSQSKLADELGIEQSSVSGWVRGISRPEAHHRKAIEILLGIAEGEWLDAPERSVISRAHSTAKARPTGTDGR